MQRLPKLTNEDIIVIAGIPMEELRHTRAAQDWLAAGRQEGAERRSGVTPPPAQPPLLKQLETLADALLDIQDLADLAAHPGILLLPITIAFVVVPLAAAGSGG